MKQLILSLSLLLILTGTSAAQSADTLRFTLHAAMNTAQQSSLSGQTAEATLREAEARVQEAKGALLPTVTATAANSIRSFNFAASQPPKLLANMHLQDNLGVLYNVQDARLSARVSVLNLAAWRRLDAAQQNVTVARENRNVQGSVVSAQAADAWYALARARQSITIKQRLLDLATQIQTIAETQKASGSATQFDVIRAQGQVAVAQAALLQAQTQAQTSSLGLQKILNLSMNSPVATTDTLDDPNEPMVEDLDSVISQALSKREEILAAQQTMVVAEGDQRAISSEALPTIDLAADYGASAYQFDNNEFTGSVSAQLTWSLWDGSRRNARKAQQQERIAKTRIQLQDLRQGIEFEVRSASNNLHASRDAVTISLQREDLARQELALAEERFKAGMSGLPDVITAQNNLSLASDALLDARYRYHQARLSFCKATHQLETL